MPWQNVTPMEEIIRFVTLAQTDRFTITDLCEQFGISRKTAYKHLERHAAGGLNGQSEGVKLCTLHWPGRHADGRTVMPRKLRIEYEGAILSCDQPPKLSVGRVRAERSPFCVSGLASAYRSIRAIHHTDCKEQSLTPSDCPRRRRAEGPVGRGQTLYVALARTACGRTDGGCHVSCGSSMRVRSIM